MIKVIALDVGSKNVGVARSRSGVIAEPVAVWPRRPQTAFLQQLRDLLDTEQVELVVIGQPAKLTVLQQVDFDEFIHEVERLGVPVELIDEDFSTQEAQARTKPKTKQPRGHADAVAAQIILERYLER
ncbi:MAG: Holliday junction resolvase RuvX [bacterium]|nr:Holliday junction resolvase RuvX [bacterium]